MASATLTIDSYIFSEENDPDNEVFVKKTITNINALQETYDLSEKEIDNLVLEDGCIEIFKPLYSKGFLYRPETGFFKRK